MITILSPTKHVDLWLFSIDPQDYKNNKFLSILSIEEQEKAAKFHFSSDREKFVISHGIMRQLLSSYLACDPQEIQYEKNAYGKPSLSSPSSYVHFNLSHSSQLGALAVSSHPIGVDIEYIHVLDDYVSLTKHFLSEKESKYFRDLESRDQKTAFYRAWTIKEAYIKAIGMGLSYPIEQVTMSINERAQLLEDRSNPSNIDKWSLYCFEHENYLGALTLPKGFHVEIIKI
ncbi:4'-phosphopantetheinyl transferase family protein [Shimazuella kribbensis]|uniref:4'-phosphopantetheinyl transferase family protein n=1 Tax=Shimazuella kribbensis TaxID=139808 RepID=UPI00040E5471|nr:4'-phosphopantetheinyl transferase superfamily protein [Shimazuella kribbensis]